MKKSIFLSILNSYLAVLVKIVLSKTRNAFIQRIDASKMISQLFVVVSLLINFFHYGSATVQPSLLNLNAKVSLDYDLLTTADKVIDKNLYHYQVTGSYNSTQRPYS